MIRVAINGFGRIGRNFVRCWLGRENSNIDLVAINDTSDPKTNAHLLKYDTMLGTLKNEDISADENSITLNGKTVKCTSDRNPENLPWKEWEIDLIIESTGVFTSREGATKHLNAGAKKVLITAPGKNDDGTFVVGVNDKDYDHNKHVIISNASCTTNCLAPIVKILHEKFGIIKGTMTTTHSYTGDQRLLDASHRDVRRARAAAVNEHQHRQGQREGAEEPAAEQGRARPERDEQHQRLCLRGGHAGLGRLRRCRTAGRTGGRAGSVRKHASGWKCGARRYRSRTSANS